MLSSHRAIHHSRRPQAPGWDRTQFGRVLRQLRREAGFTQIELAERLGRDRRRIMVLEQGTAVRVPGPSELVRLAASLGVDGALLRLEEAAQPGSPAPPPTCDTPRAQVSWHVASAFNDLLTKLDELHDRARQLARSADQSFAAGVVSDKQALRAHRVVADALSAVLHELQQQAARLRALTGIDGDCAGAECIVEFRLAQARYWSRCARDSDWLAAAGERPDAVEHWLDVLDIATFHLDQEVSQAAAMALRLLSHVFLLWSKIPLRVVGEEHELSIPPMSNERSQTHQAGPPPLRVASAVKPFLELTLAGFAEALSRFEAPRAIQEDVIAIRELWPKLEERLPLTVNTDSHLWRIGRAKHDPV